MKNRLQLLTVVALLMAASFGLRNLMSPTSSTMAASVVSAVSRTGTGGPVPPPTLSSWPSPTPDVCTGTGGPVPPTCLAPRKR